MSSSSPTVTTPKPKSSPFNLAHLVPPWVTANLTVSSFKLLARSWIASWVAFLLILPSHSLNTFGNAAFFACMSSVLAPPAAPVQVFFYAMMLVVLASLLGWAWGCAAMRVALAVRDQTVLFSELERAQRNSAVAANPDAVFRLEVFQGDFLDTRSSVIYGVFLAVGCFFFAVARAYSPKYALFSVFGTIFLDIICCYGPLFPAQNYTILESFLTSTAAYVAIGCASIVIFFPQSLSHQILGDISRLFVVSRQLVEIQEQILSIRDVNDLKVSPGLATQVQGMMAGMFGRMQNLTAGASMLSAEFSVGRFNGEDIEKLIEPLTILTSRLAGLQNFSKLVGDDTWISEPQSSNPSDPSKPSTSEISNANDPISVRNLSDYATAVSQNVHIEDVLPLLHAATAELRSACVEALSAAYALITHINTTRWRPGASPTPELETQLDALRRAIDTFTQQRRLEVIEPFAGLGPLETDGRTLPRRALFYAFVFQANLEWCAHGIVHLLEILAETTRKRPRARLWAPKSLRSLWKILKMQEMGSAAAQLGQGVPADDPVTYESARIAKKRDPDSNPPTNIFQHMGNFVYKGYRWCTTPEAIYAFKYTFISIALWLPGVFRTSAYTNYVNKGIWALIMAQTTLEPFMADQIYSYFSRLTASAAGIFIGLAAWHIGAGIGEGNPYGIAAIMGVLLVPLLFWRIFCPSILPPIMCAISVILVVGYSWIDAHLFLVGNPGVGWPVAWRRWVLVLIGSGASGVMMFIPPRSARKAVRLANAAMISELSRLYGVLISKWIMVEEEATNAEKAETQRQSMSKWSGRFRADFSIAGARLQMLKARTSLARWEGSIRGAWAVDAYNQLHEVETEMLLYLAQLANAVYHLDPEWRMHLLHRTKFLNPNFIAEVMSVFSLVSRSLETGEPLQETLPNNLVDRVFYHHSLTAQPPNRKNGAGVLDGDHWEHLRSPEFLAFATGVTAVYKILSLLDRLHGIAIELCGQTEMRGFAEWKEVHEIILTR